MGEYFLVDGVRLEIITGIDLPAGDDVASVVGCSQQIEAEALKSVIVDLKGAAEVTDKG